VSVTPEPWITRRPLPLEIVPIVRLVSSVVVPVLVKKAVLPVPLAMVLPLQFVPVLHEPDTAVQVPLWARAGSCHKTAATAKALPSSSQRRRRCTAGARNCSVK
jgi:hypothetical protein